MSALELILVGGLLGATGQVVRVVVGVKKVADRAAEGHKTFAEEFSASEMGMSLVVGFAAGILAALGLTAADGTPTAVTGSPDVKTMLGVMAAGYAGTDFIEGFAKKYLPGGKTASAVSPSVKPNDGDNVDKPDPQSADKGKAQTPEELETDTSRPPAMG